MDSVNVVIDTNVLVSALKSKNGASFKLLLALANGNAFTANISVPLFIEYEAVTKRDGMVKELSSQDIDVVLDFFLSRSNIRKIYYLWRPYLKDPKDDLVLEVAVESQSQYIITHNKADFKNCNKFGIQIVTPQEFLALEGI